MNLCEEIFYSKDDIIGNGSFSTIYKGKDIINNKIVAIKSIKPNRFNNKFNEINILQDLKECDNIIQLYTYYNINNNIYLILKYCPSDLNKYIKQHIYLQEDKAQNYFIQIVNALKVLYNKNLYHRDLKPSNILIDNDIIYLCDFNLSTYITDFTDDNNLSIVGSPLYMALEVFNNKYDKKSDLWSLGLILFEMVSGYNFLKSKNMNELVKNINNLIIPNMYHISNSCYKLITLLIEKNIDIRISWEELFIYEWINSIYKLDNKLDNKDIIINEDIIQNKDIINSYNIIDDYYINSDESTNKASLKSSNDFLILSLDNKPDIYSIINNEYSFSDLFNNSIGVIKNIII